MRPTEDWDWRGLRSHCEREARRLVRNRHDADDVVQEALARAWRKRNRCRSPETPVPWLLQITRNEAFRFMDRSRTVPVPAADVAGKAEPSSDLAPDQVAERLDLHRALARLPSDDRRLAQLRYEHDLTQTKIADVLDMPEGTVKVRLHRLRERIRAELRTGAIEDRNPA